MTILRRRRCRWKELVGSLCLVSSASPVALALPQAVTVEQHSINNGNPADSFDQPADGDLYLEVVLNQLKTRQIGHFSVRGGRLHARAATLAELGLAPPPAASEDDFVPLDSLPGVTSHYNHAEQRLHIDAPVAALHGPVTRLGYQAPPPPQLDPATRAPGLLLNYDVYGQKYHRYRNLSGWSELRLFGAGPGVWRTDQYIRANNADGTSEFRSTRLATSWQLDFPDSMISVALGDANSGALAWTRSMRMGGIRVSRNFNLQPYRVTVPLASFVGETALPSTVDLIINGVREARKRAPPGEFEVVSAPIVNGAGNAQMVITDVTGRRRVIDFAFYNSARMLQKGLADWSFEAGALRTNFGRRSFSYADAPVISGSVRYGAADTLTLETHGENAQGLTMGGAGALIQLGARGGIVSTSFAASSRRGRRGRQYGVGYEWQNQRFNLNVSTLRRDQDFRDIGTLVDSTLPLRTSQAFLGVNVGPGQLGASYVRQSYPDYPTASYAGVTWGQSLGRYGHLNVGINRDISGGGGTNAYVYWSLPLGGRHQVWASAARDERGKSAQVGAARLLPGDRDGWGWRLQAGAGEEAGGLAEVSQLTRYGQWRAAAQTWDRRDGDSGNESFNAEVMGGLVWMQGSLFPMRRVYDAFALVSTDGIAGVPVNLENRFVGNTDDKGQLLVTPLNAWEKNDISISAENLPADVRIERLRIEAVPATQSGMLVRFPMKELLTLEFSARLPDGTWVPAGTDAVMLPGGDSTTVGYGGSVYLEAPPAGGQLRMDLGEGACSVSLPAALPPRGRLNLGVLTCR